ncbi:MAG: flagellar brake protein [Azoarcus sp.]|jgi:c-di-GMP-binding flagellar brake protein YcgR|nr:flagellar brake protein [Azoarcus sp.]
MSDQDYKQIVASLQGDDLEQYLLRGRVQIRQILRELITSNAMISLHLFPSGASFLSTLLALSEDEEWLFFDVSPSEIVRRHALEAEHVLCVTQLNKIRIQFRLASGSEIPVDGRPAFAALVPDEILRMQRRDAFRLQVPLSHHLSCLLPPGVVEHAHSHDKEKDKDRRAEAIVVDISAGGLSIEIPAGKTTPTVGDKFEDCQLKLPNALPVIVSLEVRNHGRRIRGNGKEVLRLGCSFISLNHQAESRIQRYIFQAEREINAKSMDAAQDRQP